MHDPAETIPALGWELTCTSGRHNKFYRYIVADGQLIAHYGAIGSAGQVSVKSIAGQVAMTQQATRETRERLGRSYMFSVKATPFEVTSIMLDALKVTDADERRRAVKLLQANMDEAVARHSTALPIPTSTPDFAQLTSALVAHLHGETAPTATPPAPAAPPRRRPRRSLTPVGPTRRASGETYQPRTVGGHEDLALLRAAREHGDSILLAGCPGTGKTALLDAAFEDAEVLIGTRETSEDDFLGTWVQDRTVTDRTVYRWAPGPLQRSLENKVPLFVDEIALIDPRVTSLLYPLLDGRGEIRVPTNPDLGPLGRPDGWILVAAYNPDVPGAHMSDALRDRFGLTIEVGSDFDVAEELGVAPKLVTIARNLDTRRRDGEISWSPQLRALLTFRTNSDRYGEQVALANLMGAAPPEDRDVIKTALGAHYKVDGPLALGERHRP